MARHDTLDGNAWLAECQSVTQLSCRASYTGYQHFPLIKVAWPTSVIATTWHRDSSDVASGVSEARITGTLHINYKCRQ